MNHEFEAMYVPREEISRRMADFQRTLDSLDVAVAWIEHANDLYYYTGSIQDAVLLVPAVGEPLYFVRKSRERAAKESPLKALPFEGRGAVLADVGKFLKESGHLGLSLDVLPAKDYLYLLRKLDTPPVKDIAMAIRLQRAVKSDWELEQIRVAAGHAEETFASLERIAQPGRSELEISADVERFLRIKGHGGTIRLRKPGQEMAIITVSSGKAACAPTNFNGPIGAIGPSPASAMGAGHKRFGRGETLMLDMVSNWNGYNADNARTFYAGKQAPEFLLQAHDFCIHTMMAVAELAKPGAICSEIFTEVAQKAAERGEPEGFLGYGENRVKFFGHGVGIELDELPVIANKVDIELKENMVIAIEPKAFFPTVGPVGAENTFVVTKTGCESLCKFPNEIYCLEHD